LLFSWPPGRPTGPPSGRNQWSPVGASPCQPQQSIRAGHCREGVELSRGGPHGDDLDLAKRAWRAAGARVAEGAGDELADRRGPRWSGFGSVLVRCRTKGWWRLVIPHSVTSIRFPLSLHGANRRHSFLLPELSHVSGNTHLLLLDLANSLG